MFAVASSHMSTPSRASEGVAPDPKPPDYLDPDMKRLFAIISLGVSVLGPIHVGRAAEAAPVQGPYTRTESLDLDMLRRNRNFGYSDEEITKYFNHPQTFEYDTTGLAAGRLEAPPAPGVHPRIWFTSADLPALRKKLAESKPAKMRMDGIRAKLRKDLTGPSATFAALYDAAARGEGGPDLLKVEVACPIIYETFRCLIDNDEAGAKKAAAAVATLAKLEGAELDKAFAATDARRAKLTPEQAAKEAIRAPLRDYQETMGLTQNCLLGFAYDFAYPWMTAQQRDTVRATIAKSTANMTLLCAEGLPAFPANTSNWIPMHMRIIPSIMAIEGEPGYDPATLRRAVAGYERYLTAGFFPAGDMYESMGKNFLCMENMIPVANRGNVLPALKNVRTQIGGYYLHAMNPWGGHFTFYDSLGGRGNTTPMFDALVEKHLFPDDPAIDFVYRNTVGENYEAFNENVRFSHPFHLVDPLVQAVFAEEFLPRTWDQALAAATIGKGLTFFSEGTGNLITRTAWDKDALQFHFLTRCVSGGHQYADRTSFSLYADGRYWAIYKPLRQVEEHYEPRNRSVILVDGKGPGLAMTRCAAMQDDPNATFICADAKTAYDWTTGGNNRFPKGGQRVPFTANDFRLQKSTLPWMNLPWSDLPNWQTSFKGSELWLPNNEMQRAFRTAGLVRGKHPYVLIADDFQKDDNPHEYNWGMIVEDDVVQAPTLAPMGGDVVLGEKGKSGADARFLLVRLLNSQGVDPNRPAAVEEYELPNPPQRPLPMHRLSITSRSVAPDFKTLLFPYRQGQETPQTTWNADRTHLTIAWKDQRDEVAFAKSAGGQTAIQIVRDGKPILAID